MMPNEEMREKDLKSTDGVNLPKEILQQREGHLCLAIELIADNVMVTDSNGCIEYVNGAFEITTGFTRSEVIGKNPNILKSGKHDEHYYIKLWETIRSGQVFQARTTNKRKNGELYYANQAISSFKNSQGQITHYISIWRDITKEVKAEEKLRESEHRFRAAFDYVAAGMALVSPQGKWLKVNRTFCEMLGFSQEELLSRTMSDIIYPEDLTIIMDKIEDLLNDKFSYFSIEKRCFHKHGFVMWILLSVSLVRGNMNEPLYFVAEIQDMTEKRKAQEKSVDLMNAKARFTSMVSHELRTPLTAIKEGISIVADEIVGQINKEQKEYLELAGRNVDRLKRLINDILDFQKLESGRMVFDLQNNDINELCKEVYRIMVLSSNEKSLSFILELEENLPMIKMDKDRIHQVLVNFINNAIKFTDKGSIKLATLKSGNMIEVKIKDSGCGIAEADMGKLFQSFEQIGDQNKKALGTGLGLVICKEIVERHHGKIWVESEFGKGATFIFSLPIIERRQNL